MDLGQLAPVIGSWAAAIVTLYLAWRRYRAVDRKTEAQAEKTAVEGYDSLTKRLMKRLDVLEAKLQENETKMAALEKELAMMREENADLRRQLRGYEMENQRLRAEIAKLQQRLEELGANAPGA